MSKNRHLINIKKNIPGLMFVFPFLFFFLVLYIFPLFKAIQMSLFDLDYNVGPFVWFQNYIYIFQKEEFLQALGNTFLYVVFIVPSVLIVSLFISINIYNKNAKIQTFFRAAFYLPVVASGVVLSMVWVWMYNPITGIINYVLSIFHIPAVIWLGETMTALPALSIVLVTWMIGVPIILYLAALGNIPKTYYEVADIDGATSRNKLFYITLPLLKPTTLYILIVTTIGSFQVFLVVQLMTYGGPNFGTTTIMFLLYKEAFVFGKLGSASAMGVVMAAIIFIVAVIQYKYLATDVEY